MDTGILIELIETLGLPAVIIAASFWYINKKDTFFAAQLAEWQVKDDKEDDRLVHLIEKQNDVMRDQTAAVRELLAWVKQNPPRRR